MRSNFPVWVVAGLVLAACSADASEFEPGETGEVTAVSAVLTLIMTTQEGGLEVRLAELDSVFSESSDAALIGMTQGRSVRLAYGGLERDRFGRALAQVYLVGENGPDEWLQAHLVEQGLARVLTHADNRAAAALLLPLEAEARANRAGFWRDPENRVRDTHPDALAQDVGSVQLVEGRVMSVVRVASGRTYLNFGLDWRTDFTVAVEAGDLERFETAGLDLAALATRQVRVRGWISEQNGPMIRIDHPERIEILPD
jgi:micrococcal nuclease